MQQWQQAADKAWRMAALAVLCACLGAIACNNIALAVVLKSRPALIYNAYQDAWITLSARPLGMGGALTAVPDPASVFYNPAGLASLRRLTLTFNHSARHFPGIEDKKAHLHKADQLDADTEAIVVPLPCATYAHGFTFRGEYGYDYRPLDPGNNYWYPRNNVNGGEEYDALAFSGGLPVALGYSLRRQFLRCTPDPAHLTGTPAWLRNGQGEQWGLLAHVGPGLDYGQSESKLNFDWTLLEPSPKPDESFAEMHSKQTTQRSGMALHPCAWLTLAGDSVHEEYMFPNKDAQGFGTIHHGYEDEYHGFAGGELCLGQLAKWRWGNYDGSPTVGASFNFGGLWLNYAEAKDLLPELIGWGGSFKDVHIYGAEARF